MGGDQGHVEGQSALTTNGRYLTTNQSDTKPHPHTHSSQGQTRSLISNPVTESLLQLTVHLEVLRLILSLKQSVGVAAGSENTQQLSLVFLSLCSVFFITFGLISELHP